MDIKEIALKVAQSTNLHYIVTSEIPTNDDWNIRFAEALISAHKAELLKGVGEPVAYYDPDLDCGSAGISFDPLSDGIGLYTSDQVAAAILKMTGPLEDQLAKAEQRVAEACALTYREDYDLTDIAERVRAGEWRKFLKEV